MKLYWKIFLLTTSIMMLLFTAFGSLMIYFSFQNGLNYELNQGYSDQRMYHLLLSSRLSELMTDIRATSEKLKDIEPSLQSQFSETTFEVFEAGSGTLDGEQSTYPYSYYMLYESLKSGDKSVGYRIIENDGHYLLIYLSRFNIENVPYYIGSFRSIDQPYQDREMLYNQYIVLAGAMMSLGCILLFFVSRLFTKNIEKLRDMTKQLAGGDYSARVDVKSADEIGDLSRDINQMADRLDANIEELKAAVIRQEDFTAAFSHELKTPMTAIIGYSEMLRSMQLTEEETIEYADYIYSQGKRLEKLSLQMLDFMHLTMDDVVKRRLSISVVVDEAVRSITPAFEIEGVTCLVQVEAGYVYGNRELLVMVLTNLLDNARKASEKGKRVLIKGTCKTQFYELLIIDEGRGIPEADIRRVTEAFYMVDKSRARKQGGSGLGLALCRKIIDKHQGRMDIRSDEGKGTGIRICLPNEGGI